MLRHHLVITGVAGVTELAFEQLVLLR